MRPVILLTCSGLMGQASPSARTVVSGAHPDKRAAGPAPGAGAAGGAAGTAVQEADTTVARREGLLVAYIRSVVLAGGAPVLLPNTADPEAVASAVRAAAGLILAGGGDIEAHRYGRQAHPSMTNVDALRDATELAAIDCAVRGGLPILGICRGIQVLNVALGGTLIQDLPLHLSGRPGAVRHDQGVHDVRLAPGGLLRKLWPQERKAVNSSHHQACDQVAPGLRATGWSDDGIIEAVESADGRDLLGLQCHPERLAEQDPAFLAPFGWLVDRARRAGG